MRRDSLHPPRCERLERRTCFADVLSLAGSIDPTFGVGGEAIIDRTQFDSAQDLVALADGGSLLLGQHFPQGAGQPFTTVTRFDASGVPDANFGTGGAGQLTSPGGAAMVVGTDGRIVVAGATLGGGTPSPDGAEDLLIQRLNADGTPDSTFGTAGSTTTDVANRQDVAVRLLQQTDGKLLVVGYEQKAFLSRVQQTPHIVVTRYTADGLPDTDFGVSGVVVTDVPGIDAERASAAVLQDDGKLVVVGTAIRREESFGHPATPARLMVLRYNADGTLDRTFGGDGVVITRTKASPTDVAIDAGRILVAATRTVTGGRAASVVAFRANGARADGFGHDGVATARFAQSPGVTTRNDAAGGLKIDGQRRLVLSAAVNGEAVGLARFKANGRPDRSFGEAGSALTPSPGAAAVLLSLQPDGNLLTGVGGTDIILRRHLGNAD